MISPREMDQGRAQSAPQGPEPGQEGYGERTVRSVKGRVVGTSSPQAMELIGTLRGVFHQYQKQLLDLFEVLSRDEHQWATLRRIAMDIQSQHLRMQEGIIRQAIVQALARTEKETGTDDSK